MFFGLLDLPWWGYIVAYFVLTHLTALSITIFLHRNQAHRALDLHPAVAHVFRFWLWLTTGMETKAWTAIHRKHHSRCETEDDPHSPQVLGIKKVFWEGAELYRKEAKNQETLERYGQGTPNDWIERNVYVRHTTKGIYLMLVIDILLMGIPGVTIWALQMMWTPLFAAGVINGIGHYWGYRNYECPDAATNIVPWGIFIAGEELHNNHHTFGTSAKFSVKPWEFDIGWAYIRVLSALGLATVKRLPPELHIEPEKSTIDMDTVKAVITNRFNVMAHYAKEVVHPVFHELREKSAHGKEQLTNRIKKLLTRHESLVCPNSQQQLQTVLNNNGPLQVVYDFHQRLQAIWSKTTATQKELLDALQEWCHHAEATGINVLQKFAEKIRTYTQKQDAV